MPLGKWSLKSGFLSLFNSRPIIPLLSTSILTLMTNCCITIYLRVSRILYIIEFRWRYINNAPGCVDICLFLEYSIIILISTPIQLVNVLLLHVQKCTVDLKSLSSCCLSGLYCEKHFLGLVRQQANIMRCHNQIKWLSHKHEYTSLLPQKHLWHVWLNSEMLSHFCFIYSENL